jgi:hypothetical protein
MLDCAVFVGWYSKDGIRIACPAGTYGALQGIYYTTNISTMLLNRGPLVGQITSDISETQPAIYEVEANELLRNKVRKTSRCLGEKGEFENRIWYLFSRIGRMVSSGSVYMR